MKRTTILRSLALTLLLASASAQAGPFADYLRALQPLPAQLPTPMRDDTELGGTCEEGEGAAAAKAAVDVAVAAGAQAEAGAYEAGVEPGSTGAAFAPAESPEMLCASRFRSEMNAARADQLRMTHEYNGLRVKTLTQQQRCRPAMGGENADELKADCFHQIHDNLAVPYADGAQKIWPSYWITQQARLERLRRELGVCVLLREVAEAKAIKAGALRQGNAALAKFMKDTREPVLEFAELRSKACRSVIPPVRASQWRYDPWVTYGPAKNEDGQMLTDLYSLIDLP